MNIIYPYIVKLHPKAWGEKAQVHKFGIANTTGISVHQGHMEVLVDVLPGATQVRVRCAEILLVESETHATREV